MSIGNGERAITLIGHFPYDCIIFLRVYLRTGGAIGAQRLAVRAFGERVILRSELSPDLQLSPSISATHLELGVCSKTPQ